MSTKSIKFCDICGKQMIEKENDHNFEMSEKIKGSIVIYLNNGNASDVCKDCTKKVVKNLIGEKK